MMGASKRIMEMQLYFNQQIFCLGENIFSKTFADIAVKYLGYLCEARTLPKEGKWPCDTTGEKVFYR